MILRATVALVAMLALSPATAIAREPVRGLDDCDARVAAHPGDFEAFRCFWLKGRSERRLDDAALRLEAYVAARGDGEPGALLYLGLIAADLSQERALELFRRATLVFVRRGEIKGEVYARISTVIALRFRGLRDEAEAELELAERAAAASGNVELPLRVLAERASGALADDDYGLAYALFRECRDGLTPDLPPDLAGRVLSGLGVAAWHTFRLEESRDAFRAEAEHHRLTGNRWAEAMARAQLMLYDSPWLPRADRWRRAREAEALAREVGNPWAELIALDQLASWSDGPDRGTLLARRLAVARSLDSADHIGRALRDLGSWLALAAKPSDPDGGLRRIGESIALARTSGRRIDWANALSARAETLAALGRPEEARADWHEALELAEALRAAQPDATTRRRVSAELRWIHKNLALHLLARGAASSPQDVAQAFAVLERMRADALPVPGPDDTPAAWTPILLEIARVQRRLLDPELPDPERATALTGLMQLESELEHEREAHARGATTSRRAPAPHRVSLDQLRDALGRRALLIYLFADRPNDADPRGRLLAISAAGVTIHDVPGGTPALEREIELFVSLLERGDGAERAAARRLHADLLAPALAGLPAGTHEVVIVPDGPLYRLPFDRLADTADPMAFTLAPSASSWLACTRRPVPPPGAGVLVLADPRTGGDVADPATRRDLAALGAAGLGALPYARREGRAAERFVRPVRVLYGPDASERRVKTADLRHLGILHLAAHAIVDAAAPERSAVLLHPGADDEDGLLQAREIRSLALGGGVVVVSACRSATGELWRGGEIGALADAFLGAGARAFVGTLWPVRDDEAAAFADRFYRRLAQGLPLAEALARAKRDRARTGAPPSAWAAFTLVGDGSWAPFPGGVRSSFPWAAALAVTALTGAFALGLATRTRQPKAPVIP